MLPRRDACFRAGRDSARRPTTTLLLRWNSCAWMIMNHADVAPIDEEARQGTTCWVTEAQGVARWAVLQRVTRAKVTTGADVTGEIGRGWLVLLGIAPCDGERDHLARREGGSPAGICGSPAGR